MYRIKHLFGGSLTLRDYNGQVAGFVHGSCAEQDDKGRNAGKRAYCLKICRAKGALAPNLIYSTKLGEVPKIHCS